MLSTTHFPQSAAAGLSRTPFCQDAETKPSTIELLGPAAVAAATLVGARLLNLVAQAMS